MNNLAVRRGFTAVLVALLLPACAKPAIFGWPKPDGNPVHFHLSTNVERGADAVSVKAEGAWNNSSVSVPCINQNQKCYVLLEYYKLPPSGALRACKASAGESCLTINAANSYTGTAPPFVVKSEAADGSHPMEQVNGEFVVIFSANPLAAARTH